MQALIQEIAQTASLLDGLSESEWNTFTRCDGWRISDVVLHLAQSDEMAIASLNGSPSEGRKGKMNSHQSTDQAIRRIARTLQRLSVTLAVAESLTGGMLTSRFAAGPEASSWLAGGVVAYTRHAKQNALGVGDDPLVSEETARQMARGAQHLLGADVSVAVTGAAGPTVEDGAEVGEVWIAAKLSERELIDHHVFNGGPHAVCEQTCEAAVQLILALVEASPTGVS